MEPEESKPQLNAQILEEAAEWLIEFSAGGVDAGARQRFDSWLRTSPEHVRAYLELLPIWEEGALPPPHPDAGPDALIALARSTDNIVPLPAKAGETSQPAASSAARLPRRRTAIAASAVLACVAGGTLAWLMLVHNPPYTTQVGEQRSIALPDGSMIELNARSSVRVRFTSNERTVDLLEGQALFHVAKDNVRPFIVASDGTRVRAVGTEFDVYRKKTSTTVTVLEGRVTVARAAAEGIPPPTGQLSSSSILLSSGEQVTVTASATPRPTRANLAAATAWTQRRLVFDASTLADVVEEFNRYNAHRLVIRDAPLESFPISATFSSTDPASLVRFLQAQPGISVVEMDDESQVSVHR
jgi:transmembrane sensor